MKKTISILTLVIFFKLISNAQNPSLVFDINTVADEAVNPADLFASPDLLYLTMNTSALDVELYRSDGTSEGTFLLKDISAGGLPSSPRKFSYVNGLTYFTARLPR